MESLYPINEDILYVLEQHVDHETGEITPEGDRLLDALGAELQDRALGIAYVIKELAINCDAINAVIHERKAAHDALKAKAMALIKKLERDLESNKPLYDSKGKQVFASDQWAEISWGKSQATIIDDATKAPVVCMVQPPLPPPVINKPEAKKALAAYAESHDGKYPKWGHVEKKVALKIK